MIRFLVRRAVRGLLVIWLITLVVFGMFFVAPGNVAQTLGGRQATPETLALIDQRLGLDRPIWQQYLDFVGNALRGDLGYDYYKQIPVTTIIADALPKTVSIALGAAIIWLLLGVTNGVLSAVRPRSFLDRGITVAGSSDRPVADGAPLRAIEFMVRRRSSGGRAVGPDEAITVEEAIRAYTLGAAHACRKEHVLGSLTPGKLADLAVLGDDPRTSESIAQIPVLATMVGGSFSFQRSS